MKHPLHEKYPYSEFFLVRFSHIRSESGEILRISPESVRMRENMYQKNSEYEHFSRSDPNTDTSVPQGTCAIQFKLFRTKT